MSLSAKCCVCTDEFQGIDDLEAHISADHYNCLPFECEKCKFAKFPTEFAIKRHYEEDHGLVEYFIRYRVSREIYEKKQKIRECLERCIRHSDVGSGQHQINLTNRSIIGSDYSSSLSHYQSRLHENEFLAPSSSKVRGNHSTAAELFQQQHGPLLSSAAADLRHQHQSDFGIGTTTNDTDSVSGYETIGGPNLIGNLLEQIKPDVDSGPLSHFDQLYAAEVSSANDSTPRVIEKFTTQQSSISSQSDQLPPFLTQTQKQSQHSETIAKTESGSSVTTTITIGSPMTIKNQLNGTPLSTVSYKQTGGRKPGELECQKCKQMVVNRSTSLMYHVNVKHLKLAMYECLQCEETFMWNKSAAIRHAQQRHGGDESLIVNNNERLFPTLNRHRREYFNLAKRGPEDSPTPPKQDDELMIQREQQEDEMTESLTSKKSRMQSATPEFIEVKTEEMIEVEHDQLANEARKNANQEKKAQTPNTILAQLVDMTRNNNNSHTEEKLTRADTSSACTTSISIGNVIRQQQNATSTSLNLLGEPLKVHKQIKCEGCGENVINQEWIMLNHVNTKHLHLPLYKCVSCNKPFENYLRSYAVRHAKFYHAGDENLLTDQRDQFWGELREACAQLFGLNNNKNGTGGADSS